MANRPPEPDALQRIPMLAELPPWQMEGIAEAVEPVVIGKGRLLIERDSDDGCTYFLDTGEIGLQAADGQLDPEEALLIGLVHDVGVIPILNYARRYPELMSDAEALELTLARLRGELGATIPRDWRFVPAKVASPERSLEILHDAKAQVDEMRSVLHA